MAKLSSLAAIMVAVVLVNVELVVGCGVVGQLYCDKCWEGGFTTGKDSYVANTQVTVTCSVSRQGYVSNFTGSDTTDSNGNFAAYFTSATNKVNQANVDLAFMWFLFNSYDVRQGRCSDGVVLGCQVSISGAPSTCNNFAVFDGISNRAKGSVGNGWFPAAQLGYTQYQNTQFADFLLGSGGGSKTNSLCLTPTTKDPSCPVIGGTGDPHFTGADGSHFDFSGEPDAHFCLLSDAHLHINAYYGGRFGEYEGNSNKALTWIRKLGIMWGHHTITLAAREGARWQYDNGYMARMEVDGELVQLSQAGDYATFAAGAIELKWLAAKYKSADDLVDIYQLTIDSVLVMRLTLRPEVEVLRTEDDGVIHFDFEIPQVDLSDKAHGVLGQTFRGERQNKLGEQKLVYSELLHTEVVPGDNAEGFLDGIIADYRSSGLLNADCRVAHFARASARDLETAQAIELASGAVLGTMGSGRKILRTSASS